ncbi:helix-turn-helix domain-containing protein [Streptomyces albicerus]|nr:helix-turn-helix transcriptional regulator [Streptomyces albicerus]
MSTRDDDVEEFAALLRRLKARTDRSYGALARRVNMNTSTLHRYCAGDAVPLDFAPVERFAALCEATPAERLELHRLWIGAVAARQRPRSAGSPEGTGEPESSPSSAGGDSSPSAGGDSFPSAGGDSSPSAPGTGPSGTPSGSVPSTPGEPMARRPKAPVSGPRPRRAWYRRRITVTAAVASALLATLGSLAALSSDRSSDAPSRAVGPTPTPTTAPGSRDRQSASPSPETTRLSPSPSPSADSSRKASESPGRNSEPSEKGKEKGTASSAVPLTWTANSQVWAQGCGHDYVIDKPPAQVPPPPAAQDAGPWAATQGALHGRETNVQISVQGRNSTAVVLEALRVRVVARATPVQGNAYSMDQGCGGALTPRFFSVNLDADRPIARSLPGGDSEGPIPAVQMPYRVSAEDPEVLLVTARTETCDCGWYLELDWSSQGRTGTVRIDDHGRPFRTTSIKGLPRYGYDTSARQWGPYI